MTLLTINNTNNSTKQVLGMKVNGNLLQYKTEDSVGHIELVDATGEHAAELFVDWMRNNVVNKTGMEKDLISAFTRYMDVTMGSVQLVSFKFNGYLQA